MNYAKDLPSIDGQLTLTGYRFADRTFNSLSILLSKTLSTDKISIPIKANIFHCLTLSNYVE
ncbi:hypothetical protein J4731_07215 [Providencia rettgeri]|nr:hypothetical protein [Providencia rettgeri]